MLNTNLAYSGLPLIARGFADCIVTHTDWHDIPEGTAVTTRDFSKYALLKMAIECSLFCEAAESMHPEGKAGLRRSIKLHDLGWHFLLARQHTGIGFTNFHLGDFGRRLDTLAKRFPAMWIYFGCGKINLL